MGRGLADVVERVVAERRRVGLLARAHVGGGEEHHRGPRHPAGVAPAQGRDQPVVVGRARHADEEHPRLAVARARRPLRGAQQGLDLVAAQPVRVVVHARAPARPHRLGEALRGRLRGLRSLGLGHPASMPARRHAGRTAPGPGGHAHEGGPRRPLPARLRVEGVELGQRGLPALAPFVVRLLPPRCARARRGRPWRAAGGAAWPRARPRSRQPGRPTGRDRGATSAGRARPAGSRGPYAASGGRRRRATSRLRSAPCPEDVKTFFGPDVVSGRSRSWSG